MNKNELMKLTKSKLEEHGRTIGLELDKRKKKQTLVEEILAHRKTLENKVKHKGWHKVKEFLNNILSNL